MLVAPAASCSGRLGDFSQCRPPEGDRHRLRVVRSTIRPNRQIGQPVDEFARSTLSWPRNWSAGCYPLKMSENSAAATAKISAALGPMEQGSVVSEVAERLLAYFTSGDIAA